MQGQEALSPMMVSHTDAESVLTPEVVPATNLTSPPPSSCAMTLPGHCASGEADDDEQKQDHTDLDPDKEFVLVAPFELVNVGIQSRVEATLNQGQLPRSSSTDLDPFIANPSRNTDESSDTEEVDEELNALFTRNKPPSQPFKLQPRKAERTFELFGYHAHQGHLMDLFSVY